MSSTKVKNRKSASLDFYETPNRVVQNLIDTGLLPSKATTMLEPGAGRGAIINGLRPSFPTMRVTAVEIQSQFQPMLEVCADNVVIGDFCSTTLTERFDLIVSNPPFSQAMPFIERSLGILNENGVAAFLLRLPFTGSVQRYSFFARRRPAHIRVLSQRPTFGGKNIDSCDYAWFIWAAKPSKTTTFDWIAPV